MKKLPNWLRWLLFLPLSIIASIFVYPIIKIINSLFDNIPPLQLFLIITGAGLTGYMFVFVAVKVVPKHKVMFSIIMASTYMILAGITLYEKLTFGKIIQMNMFETISLAVVGTIAAVITCYQTYDDLTSSSSESEKLNAVYADNSLMQKSQVESDISGPNSDDLENQVLQIISEFNYRTGEPKRKRLAKKNLISNSTDSDKMIDVYPDDSTSQKFPEDIIISDSNSDDLDNEVVQIMSILNSEIGEFEGKPVAKDDRLSSFTEPDNLIDVYQENSITPELKEDEDIPEPISKDLEKQVLQPMSELEALIEESKSEQLTEDDLLSRSTESDKLIDSYPDDSYTPEVEEDEDIPEPISKDLDQQVLQPMSELEAVIEESKSEQLTEDDLVSRSTESDELIDVYPDDSITPELKEDKNISEPISKDLDQQVLRPSSELNAVIEKSKSEHLPEDDLVRRSTESDELIDVPQDDSFRPELEEYKDFPALLQKDSEKQILPTTPELKSVKEEPKREQLPEDDLLRRSTESDELIDVSQDDSLPQEWEEENGISYLDLDDLDPQVLQTTTELNFLIRESKTNQLTKYVEDFYKSIGEDDKVALINTEIFYLWCMIVTVFDFSIDSNFRRKLIKFFNTRVINLYLKWKEFSKLDATKKPSIDFNNFSYYSNQIRLNNLHLNSSYQNTNVETVFGKIVLSKIHESMGNRKIDVDRKTVLMPAQIYYEIRQRVIEILNNSTNTICC